MAELWQIPSIQHWWLDNDEGYPPIIRSIRSFIEQRTTAPRDHSGEDVRDMKAIFSKMTLEESPRSSQSPASGADGVSPPSMYGSQQFEQGSLQFDQSSQGGGQWTDWEGAR